MQGVPVAPWGRQIVAALLFGVVYAGLSLVWMLQSSGSISNLVWLPAGLGGAALARWPNRWPGILVGLVVAEVAVDVAVFAPDDPWNYLVWPVANVAAAVVSWRILDRTGATRLSSPSSMVGLIAAGLACSAIFALSVLPASGFVPALAAGSGDLAGFLIVAPIVLTLARDAPRPALRAGVLLVLLLIVLVVLDATPVYTTRTALWIALLVAIGCAAAALAGIEVASLALIFVLAAIMDSLTAVGFIGEDRDPLTDLAIRLVIALFAAALDSLALVRDSAADRISQADRALREMNAVARTDPLTGVGNRRSLPATTGSRPGTVVMLDIDNFKRINESFDHVTGDRALAAFAAAVTACAPPGSLVARLGGDEFLVMSNVSADEAESCTEHLARRLVESARLRELPVTLAVTAGMSEFEPDEPTWEAIQRADIALMNAKETNAGQVFFAESMRATAAAVVTVEAHLERALSEHLMRAHVQPIVDVRNGAVWALEVLARMEPPGSPGPAEFVPVAMRSGLGQAMEAAVLGDLFRSLGGGRCDTSLSINTSPQNLMRPHYADGLLKMCADNGVPPGRILLEVTEDGVVHVDPAVDRSVTALRSAGVQLALDDFGTRSSALTAVTTLAPQVVKVDLSFVQAAAAGDLGSIAVIRALAVLAEELGMSVVAEGVETREQSSRMEEFGIRLQQGYLFSRPMPASEWLSFVAAGFPWETRAALGPGRRPESH